MNVQNGIILSDGLGSGSLPGQSLLSLDLILTEQVLVYLAQHNVIRISHGANGCSLNFVCLVKPIIFKEDDDKIARYYSNALTTAIQYREAVMVRLSDSLLNVGNSFYAIESD